jgi:UDP-N-acetylmuramate dehydrogenase
MDVHAHLFYEYESEEELLQILPQLPAHQPVLHIGAGSNLLFSGDYPGIILHSAIRGIETVAETADNLLLRVGAGEVWDDFVAYTVSRGLGGAENLSLIPGEVGASAVQNIGAYGAEVKDIITQVEAIELTTGQRRTFSNAECQYAYRQSIFKNQLKGRYAITYVTYSLCRHPVLNLDYGNIRAVLPVTPSATYTVKDVRDAIIAIRNEKLPDPALLGNAGSFFMNPVVPTAQFQALLQEYPAMPHYVVPGGVKIPAGWLIDQCGWKGKSLGRAGVHDRQALVLVNRGGATPDEIMALSDAICQSVQKKFGITIHPEVNFI